MENFAILQYNFIKLYFCGSKNAIASKISWDATNTNSVGLAQKLGFEYDSTYNTYNFI